MTLSYCYRCDNLDSFNFVVLLQPLEKQLLAALRDYQLYVALLNEWSPASLSFALALLGRGPERSIGTSEPRLSAA